ncbi:amidohydrolase family protein [Sphingobium sp.]|uniref:amidohydrolase family protein n=1 Tax=Sphingobium sp. TaxID=1912891 RepID=UPI0028BDF328|nr:amidohydrolase family protein [Sphingobium sp.]
MRIDIHAHFIDRPYVQELTDLLGLTASEGNKGQVLLRRGKTTYAWYREEMFDENARLRKMDTQGIDMRVLSLSAPNIYDWPAADQPQLARRINDETARMVRAHSDRFQGFATMPLADVDASLVELARAMDELDMRGIVIGSNIGGKPLDHPDLEPFWAEINRRRTPVFEHPMLPLGAEHMDAYELPIRVGFVYETTTALTRMIYGGVFERYPDFPFIVAHTGGALLSLLQRLDNGYHLFPDCREHISQLPSVYAKRLYFDTCAFQPSVINMAREIVGSDRLLFGTDDPFLSAGPEYLEDMDLQAAETVRIMSGNAIAMLGLKV